MPKTKKLVIYADRKTGSIFIRSTHRKGRGFVMRDDTYGLAKSSSITDADLGRAIRHVLGNCL